MDENSISIIFCDLEVERSGKKINELGFVYQDRELKTTEVTKSREFIFACDTDVIAGHNFIDFDIEHLKATSLYRDISKYKIIDTLPISLLLFNEKTHHSLPKKYKSEDDFKNDPVEDAKITRKLFVKLCQKFASLKRSMQYILYSLLKDKMHFKGFFQYIEKEFDLVAIKNDALLNLILKEYEQRVVNPRYLKQMIDKNSVELAYILALLTPHIEIKAHPPKILYSFTNIVEMQKKLCFNTELTSNTLSEFSKNIFGFGEFREFPRLNAGLFDSKIISQREIVKASLKDENFLCILPTGGGKTFTFWLPAIYKASVYKSLTVVISPLQALIEDHIKSFNTAVANYKAVAISGFLSPLERSEAIESVVNGEADILYIAPESLRSEAIFKILKNRFIERFVIDEVHCLSTWGNDFRQDYFYICDYINELVEAKPFQNVIPVSCFTATAKPGVIEDIKKFFFDGLGIKLNEYFAVPERKNLTYEAIEAESKNKYTQLLKILKEHQGPTLIYIPSSTKECDKVAEQLLLDTDKNVKSFHSKLDSQEKMGILQDYIEDRIDIIVATTAFGMGVDKSNIMNVIHYEVSDSLESYAQEAGRGARDKNLNAFCPILFDEDDLDKHFATLNRSKLTAGEINSILRVIKKNKGELVTKTAFELARDAGWDVEDSTNDYATKVKTILLELEREGYISRKRNKTNFFADSIAFQSMEKLHTALKQSSYSEDEKQKLILVLQSIIGRGKVEAVQIDELAYLLGLEKQAIALSINQLKELGVLGNSKDLSLEMSRVSIGQFDKIATIELALFEYMKEVHKNQIKMRELNEYLVSQQLTTKNRVELIRNIMKNWRDKSNFIFKRINREQDLWYFNIENVNDLSKVILRRHTLSKEVLKILSKNLTGRKKEVVTFSLKDLFDSLEKQFSIKEIDKALLFLHHLKIVELLYGRFINYSPMTIYKEEKASGNKRYTLLEYKNRLAKHYQIKIEAIHIMGEYAKRLQLHKSKAIKFLKDYFTLSYKKFKKEYKLSAKKLAQPITQKRYDKLFNSMNDAQKEIIEDTRTKAMMILAGPGSGKTKVLVHKIASLILREDIKPSQFMMLTFSKSAKWEFKSRIHALIGALSYDIEIQTFHSFSLKIIAREVEGTSDKLLKSAIKEATEQIRNGDITLPYISVLVLDEFQDVNEESFALIQALNNASNGEMRIIAVGDDDQCIMTHIGAHVEFIDKFAKEFGENGDEKNSYRTYELLENFRSYANIVEYANSFAKKITKRYKKEELYAHSQNQGRVNIYSFPFVKSLVPALLKVLKNEEKSDNIAILTYTNEEVMQIYSLLLENGIEAKYIIDREKFHLKDVIEIKEFCYILDSYLLDETAYKDQYFNKALDEIKQRYKASENIRILEKVIEKFLNENDTYYISQWDAYIDEVKLEDFEDYRKNIVISTIHKSKGMEFDKVFLLVNQIPTTDANKRLYYVGMTRAKYELSMLFKGIKIPHKKEYVKYYEDETPYVLENDLIVFEMSLADLQLGFDVDYGKKSVEFFAGNRVIIKRIDKFKNHCIVYENKILATLSNKFEKTLLEKFQEGYCVSNATIKYVVVWFDAQKSKNLRHPLCSIVLQKREGTQCV
ncbi:ATP-dependent DNA helicase RecQ [hydrothermal vent metagenome]|uniref:DNA 3'-5' helicase n=1 Tax=hydrothermal vent metagenome TaxID=652676 RepID=A0A1W1CUR3_9ZZZZ